MMRRLFKHTATLLIQIRRGGLVKPKGTSVDRLHLFTLVVSQRRMLGLMLVSRSSQSVRV